LACRVAHSRHPLKQRHLHTSFHSTSSWDSLQMLVAYSRTSGKHHGSTIFILGLGAGAIAQQVFISPSSLVNFQCSVITDQLDETNLVAINHSHCLWPFKPHTCSATTRIGLGTTQSRQHQSFRRRVSQLWQPSFFQFHLGKLFWRL
jgi:hypothetical protein